jgi:hypothetical protein
MPEDADYLFACQPPLHQSWILLGILLQQEAGGGSLEKVKSLVKVNGKCRALPSEWVSSWVLQKLV